MTYLGIDIGTSSVKAVLVDAEQVIVSDINIPLPISRPEPLWSEQNPADWIIGVENAIDAIRSEAPDHFKALSAIGLSGQMHGAVCLDESAAPLRPAILWNDGRSHAECATLLEAFPEIGTIVGVLPMPGFTAPKLMWMARHEPETFARIDKVVLPKDYVRLWLTGALATDMSDAAGTMWLDEASRDWSDAALDASGMRRDQMPRLHEATDLAGAVRADLVSKWGLGGTIAVAAGGGDAAVGGIGIGAIDDGDAFLSLGTSGQLFVATSDYRPAPERLVHAFAHAIPETWVQMAAMLNGASPLAWFARITGTDAANLLGELDDDASPASGPLFLPYLAGERTPLNDPHASGQFSGLTGATDRAAMTRAVLEGVALSFADCMDHMSGGGTGIERLFAIGGGARSDLWLQMIADAMNVRIARSDGAETGPAFGAARLARLAVSGENADTVCRKPETRAGFEPNPERHDAWQDRLDRFRATYQAERALRA